MSAKAPLAYRLLLLLLPPRFRRDFGPDLKAVLVERLRDAHGVAARAWVWLIAVVDVFASAPSEWAHALRHQRTGNAPGRNPMDHLKLDLRFALRSLARRPGFTAIAVITLALGIGANTAIFSVVNSILLDSPPYPEPARLVALNHFYPAFASVNSVSAVGYAHYRDNNQSFENLAAFSSGVATLTVLGSQTSEFRWS